MRLNPRGPATKQNAIFLRAAAVLFALSFGACSLNRTNLPPVKTITLPQGVGASSFRDISYDVTLDRLIVPGGSSETLFFLINPETMTADSIEVKVSEPIRGVVSVTRGPVPGRDLLFVLAQDQPALHMLEHVEELDSWRILNSAQLEGVPEYVRFLHNTTENTDELWVTEPDLLQIEIFQFKDGDPPTLEPVGTIHLDTAPPDGLIVDATNELVFTNQPQLGLTLAYKNRGVWGTWGNGCEEARGMALDEASGNLFVACREGKLVIIDPVSKGIQRMSIPFGDNLNQVYYNSAKRRVYLPSGGSKIMGIFAVPDVPPTPTPVPTESFLDRILDGLATPTPTMDSHAPVETLPAPAEFVWLQQIGSADIPLKGNCVTGDRHGNIWVCDPDNRQIILFKDNLD